MNFRLCVVLNVVLLNATDNALLPPPLLLPCHLVLLLLPRRPFIAFPTIRTENDTPIHRAQQTTFNVYPIIWKSVSIYGTWRTRFPTISWIIIELLSSLMISPIRPLVKLMSPTAALVPNTVSVLTPPIVLVDYVCPPGSSF